jgi:ParB family chromosome partitioning protein
MVKSSRRPLSNFSLRNQETGVQKELPLGSIQIPSYQPRQYFDAKKLEEMAETIKKHGILEPLLVRPLSDDQYELIAGGRRYRSAQLAGLISVPVVILELTDQEALEVALLENLQREDLNPVEETEGILRLLSLKLNLSVEEVPSILYRLQKESKGKATDNVIGQETIEAVSSVLEGLMTFESFMTNRLRLLNLPPEILEALRKGEIAYTKASAIATVKDEEERKQLLSEAKSQSLSLSEIRERVKATQQPKKQQELQERFNTSIKRAKSLKALWSEPKKRKRMEKLIAQLEALIAEEENQPRPDEGEKENQETVTDNVIGQLASEGAVSVSTAFDSSGDEVFTSSRG